MTMEGVRIPIERSEGVGAVEVQFQPKDDATAEARPAPLAEVARLLPQRRGNVSPSSGHVWEFGDDEPLFGGMLRLSDAHEQLTPRVRHIGGATLNAFPGPRGLNLGRFRDRYENSRQRRAL